MTILYPTDDSITYETSVFIIMYQIFSEGKMVHLTDLLK